MPTIYNLLEKPEYLKEVALLEYLEWGKTSQVNKQMRIKDKIRKMTKQLQTKEISKLILLEKETLIGFISIFPHDCQELPELTPWYATMYVKKEYRGKHYSKILNDAILKEAKSQNIKHLYLKTEFKNYYEKMGAKYIQKINETENLYQFDLETK